MNPFWKNRLKGPAIIAPGKNALTLASKIYKAFQGSKIFSFSPKTIEICFNSYRQIIFIGALGIATRKITPFLNNKYKDPAIIVVDSEGKFSVSLASGHLGGANILCKKVAEVINSTPVITTTSDNRGLLTPDYLASSWNLVPEYSSGNHKKNNILLDINSRIINEQEVIWEVDSPFKEELKNNTITDITGKKLNELLNRDQQLKKNKNPDILLSDKDPAIKRPYLYLRPRSIIAGIGCRKGTPVENILSHLDISLREAGISKFSIRAIASIKHKRCEKGLILAARMLDVPLYFYDTQELLKYQDQAAGSSFVKKITGVGEVCEPAAKKTTRNQRSLIMKKRTSRCKKVTIALTRVGWPWWALDPEENIL